MLRSSLRFVVLYAIALTGGCATITTGTTQTVEIRSQPDGAECALTRQGMPIGKVTTPGNISVKRGAQPISVTCAKEGYEEVRGMMNPQFNSATYGNILL